MKHTSLLLFSAFLCLVFATPSLAVDYAGAKPKAPLTDKRRRERLAVVIKDDSPVRNSPLSNSALLHRQKFGSLLYIYKESADFYLVGPVTQKGRMIGWISRGNLQTDYEALRKSSLYRKALPINNVVKGEFSQQVVFRTGPGEKYTERFKSDVFVVWFVYREENGFYLLGAQQRWGINGFVGDQKLLAGWVKKDQCYPWNSRFAINYDKKTLGQRDKAYIFDSEKSIFNYYDSDGADRGGIIMVEGEAPLPFYTSRMPINYLVEEDGNTFFNIGVPGKIVTTGGGGISDGHVASKVQHLFNEMRNRSQNIDILFVMDHTTSMGPYFKHASDAITRFVESIDSWLAGRVKFGLATYRDYAEGDDLSKMRVNFATHAASDVALFSRQLHRAERTCGDRNDSTANEAVFNGLGSAILKADWRESSSRFVILVGDHGDHPNDRNGWTTSSGLPSDKFYKTLRDKNISLFAVQTPNSRASGREAYRQFSNQFKTLKRTYEYPAEYINVGNSGSARDLLLDTLRTITSMVKSEILAVDCARAGNPIEECLEQYKGNSTEQGGLVMAASGHTTFVEKRLKLIFKKIKEMGFSLNDLNRLGESIQACEMGWIAEKNLQGVDQTQVEVMVDKAALNILLAIIHTTTGDVGFGEDQDISEMLPALLTQSVKMYTGQKFEESEGNYSKAIRMRLGLPVRNALLNQDEQSLRQMCTQNSQKCRRLLSDLKASSILLQSVISEFAVEKNDRGEIVQIMEDSDGREKHMEKEWWWRNNGGTIEYAWVPFSYFP